MPKRTDIHSILIIGSGPIVIGQGCEFDYSGVQACRALKEEGYRVVLINSNPATIMTDPEFADATYVEPISPEAVEKILEREKRQGTPIDALLPTLGGQTGLNTGMACFDRGILSKYGVKMIGADRDAIHRGEDRQVFKDLMIKIGLKVPRSGVVHNMDDARKVLKDIGLPLIIRPAFTLGGTGGGIAYNVDEFEDIVQRGLDASPVTEVLIEQSVIGWKEFEMEVMRDKNDNVVIICSIENLDAMGVHTGDSITVAPIQTLTDKEYQRMRDASIAVIRAVGVETGGSNIQFAINPDNGDMIVVEMNPRVSRSSALASKATGYPIAKLAAKLAVGYTLDELPNYITSKKWPLPPKPASSHLPSDISHPTSSDLRAKYETWTSACFEPTIDYVVIKIPRWTFEKFPDADETLTTQMKSVGEAMAIGRTFKEALQKGIRSMEVKRFGFGLDAQDKSLPTPATSAQPTRVTGVSPVSGPRPESAEPRWPIPEETLRRKLAVPSQGRLYYVRYALKMGWTIEQIHELTNYDPWFIAQMKELTDFEQEMLDASKLVRPTLAPPAPQEEVDAAAKRLGDYSFRSLFQKAKSWGYSDVQLATVFKSKPSDIRFWREGLQVRPVYKIVDTCAAEFEASTPYYYSTYETPFTVDGKPQSEDEIRLTDKPKVIIIGGGPNRIGQGIEFDYCCVQAAFACRELGLESVMINSNPETVSTDYDTSDLLFFEPLTHEDILNICERLNGGPFVSATASGISHYGSVSSPIGDADKRLIQDAVKKLGFDRAAIFNRGTLEDGSKIIARHYALYTPDAKMWYAEVGGGTSEGLRKFEPIDGEYWYAKEAAVPMKQARQGLGIDGNLVKGVIVQYGGQTPLNLAKGLADAGVPILGTTVASLDAAGDREQFRALLQSLGLKQPANGIAKNLAEAYTIAKEIGYPVLVRPSFVLGGRAMEIVNDESQLEHFMKIAQAAAGENPILIDKFLDNATEVDVDCMADFSPTDAPAITREDMEKLAAVAKTVNAQVAAARGEGPGEATGSPAEFTKLREMTLALEKKLEGIVKPSGRAVIIGVMEHIEEAGIHSGDSACSLPPYSLSKEIVERLKDQTRKLAAALKVRGLMNVQYAIKDNDIYVIEVNPRASRTVPFVGKATGTPWAKIAAKVMMGKSLDELGIHELPDPKHVSVKEVVFPFTKFQGVDVILGPEMRSTGEVMGIDETFPQAFAKAQLAAGTNLPTKGNVYISVRAADRAAITPIAKQLKDAGFSILASAGTGGALTQAGIPVTIIPKLNEGRPNVRDLIKNGQIQLILNTPTKKGPGTDEGKIRSMAVLNKVPMITTITGANATTQAILSLQKSGWTVKPLQAYGK